MMFFTLTLFGQNEQSKELSTFLPKGYVIFETISGDLNNDSIADCILIIKGTDKSKIIEDEYRGILDRNRRGIVVLFRKNDHYELAVKNYDCFSSEYEDGGAYYAPELFIEINGGNLYIQYDHGRYGYWSYTFKYCHSDFELIGYESSENRGPIINYETSINFLTKKKQTKENINNNPEQESGDEIFKEIWKDIKVDKLVKLSKIKDFDEFDLFIEEVNKN